MFLSFCQRHFCDFLRVLPLLSLSEPYAEPPCNLSNYIIFRIKRSLYDIHEPSRHYFFFVTFLPTKYWNRPRLGRLFINYYNISLYITLFYVCHFSGPQEFQWTMNTHQVLQTARKWCSDFISINFTGRFIHPGKLSALFL